MESAISTSNARDVEDPIHRLTGELLVITLGPYLFVALGSAAIATVAAIQGHQTPKRMTNKDRFLQSQWRIHRTAMFIFGAVAVVALLLGLINIAVTAFDDNRLGFDARPVQMLEQRR